ncbi:MAG: putative 4-hydroxybenzoate polyprenyltransferase [Candidatus Micrarchaeales archaeon]|nr:putative 4-hydroxybenzoate polyprenyltransferase [Candidatus Micrarchaeales archaeon]
MAGAKIIQLPELIKLEYSLFVLPFVYIGMLLAGIPTLFQFILITVALLCARGAAFSANRLFGWRYDIRNPKKKESPSVKTYSRIEMAVILVAFMSIFMASAYMLNALAFALSPLVILLALIEPHMKRYTEHRHLSMGLIIGLGILGGYIGIAGRFPFVLPIYALLAGYTFFSAANDIIYAVNHMEFDKSAGLKTYPAEYGVKKALNASRFFHIIAAAFFVVFGILLNSIAVVAGAVVAFAILMMEHRKLDYRDENSLKISFFNYNVAVSAVLILSFALFALQV